MKKNIYSLTKSVIYLVLASMFLLSCEFFEEESTTSPSTDYVPPESPKSVISFKNMSFNKAIDEIYIKRSSSKNWGSIKINFIYYYDTKTYTLKDSECDDKYDFAAIERDYSGNKVSESYVTDSYIACGENYLWEIYLK